MREYSISLSIRPDVFAPPVFIQAEKPAKAIIAYEKSLDWRELFDLAVRESLSEDELVEMGLRVAGEMCACSRSTLVLNGSSQMI